MRLYGSMFGSYCICVLYGLLRCICTVRYATDKSNVLYIYVNSRLFYRALSLLLNRFSDRSVYIIYTHTDTLIQSYPPTRSSRLSLFHQQRVCVCVIVYYYYIKCHRNACQVACGAYIIHNSYTTNMENLMNSCLIQNCEHFNSSFMIVCIRYVHKETCILI